MTPTTASIWPDLLDQVNCRPVLTALVCPPTRGLSQTAEGVPEFVAALFQFISTKAGAE
jgi:hypothetical protein